MPCRNNCRSVPVALLMLAAATTCGELIAQSETVSAHADGSAAASNPPNAQMIQIVPPTTEYRVHIQKVPVTKKFAPYKGPPVPPTAVPAKPKSSSVLRGEVGEQGAKGDAVDDVDRGSGPASALLLKEAPEPDIGAPATVAGRFFEAFVAQYKVSLAHTKPAILVIKGRWDHAEHLLSECKVPFDTGGKDLLNDHLSRYKVVVLNCPGEITDNSIAELRQFVENGGYLLSTDWSLDSAVQRAFPGYIYFDGAYTRPETVDAVVVQRNDSLVAHVPPVGPWRLDDKCEIVKARPSKALHVLVRSRLMSLEDPLNQGILAAEFTFGKGKVLHLVGHFDNNNGLAFAEMVPDPAPVIRISMRQAIAINFMLEAARQGQ